MNTCIDLWTSFSIVVEWYAKVKFRRLKIFWAFHRIPIPRNTWYAHFLISQVVLFNQVAPQIYRNTADWRMAKLFLIPLLLVLYIAISSLMFSQVEVSKLVQQFNPRIKVIVLRGHFEQENHVYPFRGNGSFGELSSGILGYSQNRRWGKTSTIINYMWERDI